MWGRGGRVVRVALRAIVGPAMGILKIDRTGFSASPGAKGYFFCPKMGINGNNVRKYTYIVVHLPHYYYNGVRTAPLAVCSPRQRSPEPPSVRARDPSLRLAFKLSHQGSHLQSNPPRNL